MQIGASNGIALNTVIGTVTVQDELVAGAYLDAHADFVLDAATYFQFANQDASNFRITRVANAAAPEPSRCPRADGRTSRSPDHRLLHEGLMRRDC
jgi:hypothetical protein